MDKVSSHANNDVLTRLRQKTNTNSTNTSPDKQSSNP